MPVASSWLGRTQPSLEFAVVILLSDWVVKLLFEYLCLYQHRPRLLSTLFREVSFCSEQQKFIDAELVKVPIKRDWVQHSALSETLALVLLPPKPRECWRQECQTKTIRTSKWGTVWNVIFWTWHGCCNYELTVGMETFTRQKPNRASKSLAQVD